MDAVKFIEEAIRRAKVLNVPRVSFSVDECPTMVVKEIEEWSAVHPRKTRQSVFLEQWPNAKVWTDGTIEIRPCVIDQTVRKEYPCGKNCADCRCEYWGKVVE